MSTSWTTPHAEAAGSTRWQTLWVPKVTVSVGGHVGAVDPSGVDLDPARRVDRDHRHAGDGSHGVAAPARRSPGRPPMPTMPSTTTSGAAALGELDDAPAGRPQRGQARLVGAVRDQHRLDPRARDGPASRRRTARRRRCRPARRAAAPGARTRRPSRSMTAVASPAAARCISVPSGSRRHQRRLGRPHLLDGVRAAPHRTPATSHDAEAMPASWESERWTWTAPSSAARAATVPEIANSGRPDESETTSASCQARSPGAPERLGQRLLGGEAGGQRGRRARRPRRR